LSNPSVARLEGTLVETGNDVGGNDVGGNDVGGNDVGGNDVGGNDVGGNDVGGNDVGGNDVGGIDVGGIDVTTEDDRAAVDVLDVVKLWGYVLSGVDDGVDDDADGSVGTDVLLVAVAVLRTVTTGGVTGPTSNGARGRPPRLPISEGG
jgi:hypothetical protein